MRIAPSAFVLIAVNLVPLAGVIMFDWRVFDILLLYWVENVIIGAINIARMLAVRPAPAAAGPKSSRASSTLRSLLMSAFFAVHYGAFCFGHLTAIAALFAGDQGLAAARALLLDNAAGDLLRSPLLLAVVAIALSHLFSFVFNFLLGGEYRRTNLKQLMHRPYARIVVLHLTIIGGGLLIELLGSPVALLVVLVGVKIAVDLALHTRERRVFDAGVAV